MRLAGTSVSVRPLQPADARALYAAFAEQGRVWDFMPVGPFRTEAELAVWIAGAARSGEPLFYTVVLHDAPPAGFGSYLGIAPEAASSPSRRCFSGASRQPRRCIR